MRSSGPSCAELPEQASDRLSEQLTGQLPGLSCAELPGQDSDRSNKQLTDQLSEKLAGQLPQGLDLPALAACLHAALQALKPLIPFAPFVPLDPFDPADAGASATEAAVQEPSATETTTAEEAGQTRTYHLPPGAWRDEQDYLREFRAGDSFTLMAQALERLSVTVALMEQIDAAQDLPEYFLQALGGQLRESLDILERIADVLSAMELVSAQSGG